MADFRARCPHCNAELGVKEQWIGMKVRCSVCKQIFTISRETSPDTEFSASQTPPDISVPPLKKDNFFSILTGRKKQSCSAEMETPILAVIFAVCAFLNWIAALIVCIVDIFDKDNNIAGWIVWSLFGYGFLCLGLAHAIAIFYQMACNVRHIRLLLEKSCGHTVENLPGGKL